MTLRASCSDGRTSNVRPGVLRIDREGLTFEEDGGESRLYGWDAVTVPSRLGDMPRQIECGDGSTIQVADNTALDAALRAAGHGGRNWANALESRWRRVLLLVLACSLVLWLVAVHGVPSIVRVVLPSVPTSLDRSLGEKVLASLESPPFNLRPSTLESAAQDQLLLAWQTKLAPQATRETRVIFRKGGWIGANALALPGGILVVTDELVQLAGNEEEVLAVLAHELGHEEGRHAMQSLVESMLLLATMALITGDTNSMAMAAPWVLFNAEYSREKEAEADAFAHAALQRAGIAPSRLGDILLRLEEAHGGDGEDGWAILISSHPATRDRVEAASRAAE